MDNFQERKVVPYLPPWAKEGCSVVKEWNTRPEYSHGYKLTEYWCTYRDKKGKLIDILKWAVWD